MSILSRVIVAISLPVAAAVIGTGPAAADSALCPPGTQQVHAVSTASSVVRICQDSAGAFTYRGTLRETGHTGVFPAAYERVRGYYVARNHGYYYLVWPDAVEVRDPGFAPVSFERAR